MNILKLAAQLVLDGTGFKAGLKEAEVASSKFANSIGKDIKNKLAGAFGVGALAYGAKKLIDFNSQIKDGATALDISTDAFQEQAYWLKQNGATTEDLTNSYKGLSKARKSALEGDKGTQDIFGALGINLDDLKSQPIEELFKRAAESFRTTDFGADKFAAAMAVFGKGAQSILPALEESLAGAADEAHRLGQVIDSTTVSSLEHLGDSLDQIKGSYLPGLSQVLLGVIKGIDFAFTAVTAGILSGIQYTMAEFEKLSSLAGIKVDLGSGSLGEEAQSLFTEFNKRYDFSHPEDQRKGRRGSALFDDGAGKAEKEQRSQEKVVSLQERLLNLDLKRLTVDEQRMAIAEKLDKLTAEAEAKNKTRFQVEEKPEDVAAELERRVKIAELQDQLAALDNPTGKGVASSDVSSLTHRGQAAGRNFIYGASKDDMTGLTREQLKVERESRDFLEHISKDKGKTLRVNP